ncbi:TIR domain-containing protein [Culicoidibacter larvae]|uniref:Molecular chaperone Tir n=1 Tax=Culicoidibacter larvae TaxID=2579976 RepID=A0A5R8Q7P7_9FIRM|nr:molecular chaperone Tir [Culicoidibacter larvae]TLG71067.1 molecular chaperone Tir [Culicoidibacter larvae]
MTYRTKTYIAADWSGDEDAVKQLYKWKESQNWGLSFTDAHGLTSARDSSLNCSIKRSLKARLDASKQFVLIVGDNTDTITAGSCRYCSSYNSYTSRCVRGYNVDFRSYIDYECDIASYDISNIVVLYNSTMIKKSLCPEPLRSQGVHIPMVYSKDGKQYWDYYAVKKALNQ